MCRCPDTSSGRCRWSTPCPVLRGCAGTAGRTSRRPAHCSSPRRNTRRPCRTRIPDSQGRCAAVPCPFPSQRAVRSKPAVSAQRVRFRRPAKCRSIFPSAPAPARAHSCPPAPPPFLSAGSACSYSPSSWRGCTPRPVPPAPESAAPATACQTAPSPAGHAPNLRANPRPSRFLPAQRRVPCPAPSRPSSRSSPCQR